MNMNRFRWFSACRTAESGKELYRQLVKQHHPDNGGSAAVMGEINDEFRRWWRIFKDKHENAAGEEYTSRKDSNENIDEFIDILDKLSHHAGLKIDLCGSWLWISGNTFVCREELKSYGCQWSKGHKKWFWASGLIKKTGKGHLTEDQITERHGRKHIEIEYKPVFGIE